MIDLVKAALRAVQEERYATAECLLRQAAREGSEDEHIFQLAEKHGFQDDFGRWNFMNEDLLDFVHEVKGEKQ